MTIQIDFTRAEAVELRAAVGVAGFPELAAKVDAAIEQYDAAQVALIAMLNDVKTLADKAQRMGITHPTVLAWAAATGGSSVGWLAQEIAAHPPKGYATYYRS